METKVAEEGDCVDLGEVGEQEDAGAGCQLAHRASHQAHGHPGGDDGDQYSNLLVIAAIKQCWG